MTCCFNTRHATPGPPPPPAGIGDRALNRTWAFPTPCLEANGGPVINIKSAPYNAVGDGVADDTSAFIAALDHVYDVYDGGGWTGPGANNRFTASRTIYLPNGTYLVSNTITYTGTRVNADSELTGHIKWKGQSRSGTIIKLKNSCAGFGSKSTPKYVCNFGAKTNFNNRVGLNEFTDFTVDCGTGNPGAIAVAWFGANHNYLANIKCVGVGGGVAGVHCIQHPMCSWNHDILIEGFDYGFWMQSSARGESCCWEHITCRNQAVAGIYSNAGGMQNTFRKYLSENTVPGALMQDGGAHLVMLDSQLNGGSPSTSGFVGTSGQFFLRNVTIGSGYGGGVVRGAAVVRPTGLVTEYVSGTVFRHTNSTRTTSLNLPILDFPTAAIPPITDWARPEDYGGSATTNVQSAMNSGKPLIYFPHDYSIGTVTVPATVKRILFMGRGATGTFRVNQASPDPLIMEGWADGASVYTDSSRTVALNCMAHCRIFRGTYNGPLTTFNSNGAGLPNTFGNASGITRYIRECDQEVSTLPFQVNGGTTVVMGFKCEAGSLTWSISGADCEILGGDQGVNIPPTVFSISNSRVAIVAATGGFAESASQVIISDSNSGTVTTLRDSNLPDRPAGVGKCCFIPLYLSV